MKADQFFVIAHRYNQSLRLNHEVYPSVKEAKAELDRWEHEDDPQHHERERMRQESYRSKMYCRKDPHPRHNDGNFEVVDLATHLHNVAVQNYDKAKRENDYRGPFNTTMPYTERLKRTSVP